MVAVVLCNVYGELSRKTSRREWELSRITTSLEPGDPQRPEFPCLKHGGGCRRWEWEIRGLLFLKDSPDRVSVAVRKRSCHTFEFKISRRIEDEDLLQLGHVCRGICSAGSPFPESHRAGARRNPSPQHWHTRARASERGSAHADPPRQNTLTATLLSIIRLYS